MADSAGDGPRRARVRVSGVVQGVGFRPFVYREALGLGLSGHVLNDERGVEIEAEGPNERIERLLKVLREEAPPMARVEAVEAEHIPAIGDDGFRIVDSRSAGGADAPVSADVATCDACLAELRDPDDRRYRYPFVNCTDCGPRFTIVRGVPYDRPLTTMASFEMCAACRAEYDDPLDRRFHAQPNACPVCGPAARLLAPDGSEIPGVAGEDSVAAAARRLREGAIVAVKGIGGYHLACDAANEEVVARLRARKHREDKPFALMAPDIASVRELVELTEDEEALLAGRERPIVIARRHEGARVAASVAPRLRDLGVMLPHAPLQHVLLADAARPLVMTSANVSDEPIAYEDADAATRLAEICDALLVHDRPVHTRTDDSVARAAGGRRPLMIRRSRGYVPSELPMSGAAEGVLGCGAELKSTFCLARDGRAWVGHHIGDLKNWETLRSFQEGVEHFRELFDVDPVTVAHDLHPDLLSTRYAQELAEAKGLALVGVQHHHAHLAACLAEHGIEGRAVGAIFDGTGYGPDRTVWGGEILAGDMASFDRAGMLMPVRLPGGDRAAAEPWRMAASWLAHALDTASPKRPTTLAGEVSAEDWSAVCAIADSGAGSPLTTSAGRLFDGVAALCGLRARVTHEGQAATELEGAADPGERGAYTVGVEGGGGGPLVIDPREAIGEIARAVASGEEVGVVAARFHNGVAAATAEAVRRAAEELGLGVAVLSGGVFQNRLLLRRTADDLEARGLRVLVPESLPPNDGGISYGQVAVASARARVGT